MYHRISLTYCCNQNLFQPTSLPKTSLTQPLVTFWQHLRLSLFTSQSWVHELKLKADIFQHECRSWQAKIPDCQAIQFLPGYLIQIVLIHSLQCQVSFPGLLLLSFLVQTIKTSGGCTLLVYSKCYHGCCNGL